MRKSLERTFDHKLFKYIALYYALCSVHSGMEDALSKAEFPVIQALVLGMEFEYLGSVVSSSRGARDLWVFGSVQGPGLALCQFTI
jgi:hypothetical protein